MALRNFNNVTSVGTLSAPLASSATSVTVTGFTGVPTVPFTVTLDRNTPTEEICLVTAVAGSTLTVTRGFDGTAAIAHSAGATIEHTAGAIEYQEANAHTNATANVHGSTGNVVGDQGAQSIFDKTLVSPVLQGDVTAGDAAVAYDPTGSRNLFRGVDSGGTDVVTIDHAGSISTTANLSVGGTTSTGGLLTANGGITVPAGKTLTASGGVTASSVTNNGNGTVAGTLGVTGATTLTGAAALNGGATVPTGKKLTLTDAPATGTDAANKSYVDGKTWPTSAISDAASAATPSVVVKRDAAGRAQVADPSASADIATKNYTDTQGAVATCSSPLVGTQPATPFRPIIRAGTVVLNTNASSDVVLPYSPAFPNALVSVVAMSGDVVGTNELVAYQHSTSSSTFRVYNGAGSTVSTGAAVRVNYIAIGW